MADREPIAGAGRPTSEMPTHPLPLATPHEGHDLLLLAAAADRDADPSLRSAAASQVASCVECAALADDLRALVTGLADLPPAMPAPRDMRLTAEQATRLRRGGLWRRLLRPFGAEGASALRPLAATLTTLGLAGILLSALPAGLGFGMGGAATLHSIGSAVDSGQEAGPGASSGGAAQQGTDVKGSTANPAVPAAPVASANYSAAGDNRDESGERSSAFGPFRVLDRLPSLPPMAWISIVLVALGVALLVLRFVAVRLT